MKQELFAIELSKGKSQRQAYMVAYPVSKKWKEDSIDQKASLLAKNVKVMSRIDELRGKVIEKLEKKALLEVKDILEFHANVIQSDIKDYLSFGMKNVIKLDSDGKAVIAQELGVTIKDSDEIDGRNIKKVSMSPKGGFQFELYDKSDSVKEMARIMGLYNDKSSILFPEPLKIDTTKELTDEQIEDLIKIYLGNK